MPASRLLPVIWTLSLAACGRDAILEAAEQQAAGAASSGAQAPPEGAQAPASVVAPGGATAKPAPGIPAEPAPGVAQVPASGSMPMPVAGTPSAPSGKGSAAAPVAGVPTPPKPGIPEEPKPAPPGSPHPSGAGVPQPGVPTPPKPGVPREPTPGGMPTGPTVQISGSVVYPGWRKGTVKVVVFDGDHTKRSGKPPAVLSVQNLERPGAFSLAVPKSAAKAYVEAAVDEDGDGRPGPLDPQGQADRYPVTVGDSPVTGLTVTLKATAPPPGRK